jgi:spore maturation protein SpmA
MLNWIWMGMIVVGVIVAGIMGRFTGENGIVEGMFAAVKTGVVGIVIPTSAMMMFFLGIMRLAETSGMMDLVARAFRPLMKWLFPEVPAEHPAMGAMVMNFAANFLGLGNAATPLGLKAMQHLDELNPIKGTATNPMCTFLAINTSSVTLIPATAMAMLAAQGVSEPYAIVGTTLLASIFSTAIAILAVIMPVIANQAGNAGQQSLAVTLRGIVLDEVREGAALGLVRREAVVGLVNGTICGVLVGAVVGGMQWWAHPDEGLWKLGLVVGVAMTAALAVGTLVGSSLPLLVRRFGADPATASTIFLTMVTDSMSFLVFLGLAYLLSGWIGITG